MGAFVKIGKNMINYYSWDQIKESKLLAPERMIELEGLIKQRFEDLYDNKGNKINGVKSYYLIENGEKQSYLYNEQKTVYDYKYHEKIILTNILTEEEKELINKQCLRQLSQEREQKYFDKAKKLTIDQYQGKLNIGDNYFDSDDIPEDLGAEYAWTVSERPVFRVWAEDIIGNEVANNGYDELEIDDFQGIKELQESLDLFAKKNENIKSYEVNYNVCILLNKGKL